MSKNNQRASAQGVAQSGATPPLKRSIKKNLHLPADPIAQKYITRFFHPFGAIVADVPTQGIESKPEWRTSKHFMQPSVLWSLHQDENKLIGIRFGSETLYATIDLDAGGDYHNLESVTRIKAVLEGIGIVSVVPIQSSASGGWHLILPFPEPVSTFGIACAIDQALRYNSFIPRPGHLEIFPNPKPYSKEKATSYKAVRCPLQPGSESFLLDDDLEIFSDDVATFLNHCDHAAGRQDIQQLKKAINQARKRHKPQRANIQKTDVDEWRSDWEEIIATGWTEHGQTNIIVSTIVGYGIVFLGLDGQELIDYAVSTATNSPGYKKYCRHQHEIIARVEHWANCTLSNQWYSPYASHPERLSGTYAATFAGAIAGGTKASNQNNIVKFDHRKELNWQRSQEAQRRIRIVVRALEASQFLPEGATNRAKAISAEYQRRFQKALSLETLHKHLHLWHPKWHICDPWMQNAQNPYQIDNYGHTTSLPTPSSIEKNAQNPDETRNYGHSPLMKVFNVLMAASAPQGQQAASFENQEQPENQQILEIPNPDLFFLTNNQGDLHSEGEGLINFDKESKCVGMPSAARKVDKDNLSIEGGVSPPVATLPEPLLNASSNGLDVIPTNASSDSVEELKKLTALRIQAIPHAKKMVSKYCLMAGKNFRGSERLRLEQIAKMQFYLDSGEPSLISEANSWAAANPGCLPFCLEAAFSERHDE